MSKILDKFGKWLLQESGKSFVFGCAVTTAVGISAINIVPQTILLEQYKEIIQLYKNGFTVPVSKPVIERFEQALNLLELPEVDRKLFKPFMINGFDVQSIGTTYSRFGVCVGVPINFTYVDGNPIEKHMIKLNDSTVLWDLEEGKLLEKSLVMSEKAQIYAMAREIQMRQTPKYFSDCFGSVGTFIAAYFIGNKLNTKYNLYARSRFLRMIMYCLVGTFMFGNYIFVKDFSQLYYEQQIDEYLKNKNPIFKEGGKEFYTNIIDRNIALRKLMGKVGQSMYTSLGNENYLFRQRHLPLIQRKTFFDSDVESL